MSEEDEISAQVIEMLQKDDALVRKHASFWNSHKKSAKELGLGSEIYERIQDYLGKKVVVWGPCESDPPDIYMRFEDDSVVGIEITELVNQAAIEAQIRKDPTYSRMMLEYDFKEAREDIQTIIREKNKKVEAVAGDFEQLVLLIHTDEFCLNSDLFESRQAELQLEAPSNFSMVFFLFSYEPAKKESPWIRLC